MTETSRKESENVCANAVEAIATLRALAMAERVAGGNASPRAAILECRLGQPARRNGLTRLCAICSAEAAHNCLLMPEPIGNRNQAENVPPYWRNKRGLSEHGVGRSSDGYGDLFRLRVAALRRVARPSRVVSDHRIVPRCGFAGYASGQQRPSRVAHWVARFVPGSLAVGEPGFFVRRAGPGPKRRFHSKILGRFHRKISGNP